MLKNIFIFNNQNMKKHLKSFAFMHATNFYLFAPSYFIDSCDKLLPQLLYRRFKKKKCHVIYQLYLFISENVMFVKINKCRSYSFIISLVFMIFSALSKNIIKFKCLIKIVERAFILLFLVFLMKKT